MYDSKRKTGFGLYFLFAFGMAWLCQVGGCIALLQQNNAVLYQLALIVTMFCPLLAVLLVQKAFLRQPTGIGWKVQGKRRFWLAAWFGPAVLTLLGAVLYFAVFPSRLDFSGSWLVAAYGGEMDAQTLRSQLGVSTLGYLLQNGLFAVLLAPAINMFPALGEEVGWRGYMMPRLKEQFGLLNGRLLGGVVWGIWHWPLMLLVGYEYGTDYLGAPLLGLVVWCVVCFALNTLLDILYEKRRASGCLPLRTARSMPLQHCRRCWSPLQMPIIMYWDPCPLADRRAADVGSSGLADPAGDEAGRKELNPKATAAALFVRRLF